MMKAGIFLLILFSYFNFGLQAQQTRGIKPIASKTNKKGTTRAVIIGISDYQDPAITDLKYAHKDAEVFARYLLSPSGGSVRKNNIQLILNEQATSGNIWKAFYWLIDSSKTGDISIIYFAGHGDVESKFYDQPGFLLFWDTPHRAYSTNGLAINSLQQVINTLTNTNKSKVIMVSDACRSGNLAGSAIDGPGVTAKAMMERFKNQILVLSCQPEEVSIEGEQWGEGRGLFSYYFVEGLHGLANGNMDSLITGLEIQRYLQEKVPIEAKRLDFIQTPIIQGNLNEVLSYLVKDSQKQVFNEQENQLPGLLSVRSRFYDESILSSPDTNVQKLYRAFEQAIEKKEFLFSIEGRPTADELYLRLIREPSMQQVKNYLGHNYAAALQDDAQQVLNKLLNVNLNEVTKSKIAKLRAYKNYPRYLERAAEILGEQHINYSNLKARQYFFEGLMMFFQNSDNKNELEGSMIMQKFRQSLSLEPYGPHTYFYMMYCQATKFRNGDSASVFAIEASKCSQTWVLPFAYLSSFYSTYFKDTTKARKYFEMAEAIDSQHILVISAKAALHVSRGEYQQANILYKRIADRDTTNQVAWLNLGILNLKIGNYKDAETFLSKAIRLDSIDYLSYHYLAVVFLKTKREEEAENHFKTALQLNPRFINGRRELARLYRNQKRHDDAEILYREIISMDSSYMIAYYELACLAALKNKVKESIDYLELAFKNGFTDVKFMINDEDLVNIRNSDEFKTLVEKYKK